MYIIWYEFVNKFSIFKQASSPPVEKRAVSVHRISNHIHSCAVKTKWQQPSRWTLNSEFSKLDGHGFDIGSQRGSSLRLAHRYCSDSDSTPWIAPSIHTQLSPSSANTAMAHSRSQWPRRVHLVATSSYASFISPSSASYVWFCRRDFQATRTTMLTARLYNPPLNFLEGSGMSFASDPQPSRSNKLRFFVWIVAQPRLLSLLCVAWVDSCRESCVHMDVAYLTSLQLHTTPC